MSPWHIPQNGWCSPTASTAAGSFGFTLPSFVGRELHCRLKADANGTRGERHSICFCLLADGTSRPILNGDFGTSPFIGSTRRGIAPLSYVRCRSLAALVARIAIANLPLRPWLPSQLRAPDWRRATHTRLPLRAVNCPADCQSAAAARALITDAKSDIWQQRWANSSRTYCNIIGNAQTERPPRGGLCPNSIRYWIRPQRENALSFCVVSRGTQQYPGHQQRAVGRQGVALRTQERYRPPN